MISHRARRAVRMIGEARFDQRMFEHYACPAKFEGTDLRITEFPNPILRAPNAEITEFDDKLEQLSKEFFCAMYQSQGVGIAAPQLGLNIQLFVYNPDPTAPEMIRKMGERVVCNPKILEFCEATDVEIEGCLSSRAECCRGGIRRAKEIQVEYQDERGRVKKKKLRGFEARVFQHEYDHIQGVLHIDRQSPSDRKAIQPYIDVLIEQHGEGGVLEPREEAKAAMQPPVIFEAVAPPPPPPKPKPAATPAAKRKAAEPAGGGGGGGMGGFAAASKGKSSKGGAGKKKKKKR